jgi:hypothetical protein
MAIKGYIECLAYVYCRIVHIVYHLLVKSCPFKREGAFLFKGFTRFEASNFYLWISLK